MKGPIMRVLANRRTLVLGEPLVVRLGIDPPELPPGVTFEEAVAVVEGTSWAKGLAEGMCVKLAGLTPGTAEYRVCLRRVSRKVAEGLLK